MVIEHDQPEDIAGLNFCFGSSKPFDEIKIIEEKSFEIMYLQNQSVQFWKDYCWNSITEFLEKYRKFNPVILNDNPEKELALLSHWIGKRMETNYSFQDMVISNPHKKLIQIEENLQNMIRKEIEKEIDVVYNLFASCKYNFFTQIWIDKLSDPRLRI